MLFPALVGSVFQALAVAFDDYSRVEIPAFAFFMLVVSITCMQVWKKKQYMLSLRWNTIGCELQTRLSDHTRFQYYGTRMKSYVDGKEILFFSPKLRIGFYVLSGIVFVLCVCATLVGVAAIYYYGRWRLIDTIVEPYQQWVTSAGVALQIAWCNGMFYQVAYFFTDLENHRMEREFYVSLSGKSFVFCL